MKSQKNIIIILVLLAIAVAGTVFFMKSKPDNEITENNINNGNNETKNNEVENSQTQTSEEIPLSKPTSKSEKEVDDTITTAQKAIKEYYDSYSDFTNYVTRNGFLFDKNTNIYITPQVLIDSEILDSKYMDESITFMYLKPSDIKEMAGIDFESDKDLEIFLLYEQKDDFIIASENLKANISKEIRNNILEKYKTDNSYVMRLYPPSEDFENLKNAIKAHSGEEDFDFRQLVKNGNFAYALFSPKNKFADLRAYVLQKENDTWQVKIDDITTYIRPYTEINKQLVNFDLNMLPKYNLSQYMTELHDDYQPYVDYMKESKQIGDTELTFFSAIGLFSYLEFSGGEKFVGYFTEDNAFTLYPVQGIEDAAIAMLTIDEDAPLFILRQC